MPRPANPVRQPLPLVILAAGAVMGGLYLAREVLIPIALAILLSFVLAPLVTRLERLKLGRIASVAIVVTLSIAVALVIGYVVAAQLYKLYEALPNYRQNISTKLERLSDRFGGFGKSDTAKFIDELSKNMSEERAPASRPTTGSTTQQVTAALTQPSSDGRPKIDEALSNLAGQPTTKPIQVEVVPRPESPLDFLRNRIAPFLPPLGTAGIVIVVVVFMLIAREDLRDRMIRLMTRGGNFQLTTTAMDEAATRISRYLLMQMVVNVSYGIPIWLGLWAIGIPNAPLWGLLATLLRFIPYIGPWIAAAGPIVVAFAAFPGYRQIVYTLALYGVIELISNNVIEPWLYGSSTGMSEMAVLVSAVFWTWLWGVPGLLLATPLTVCLVVMGKYVPQLQFLDILLGDEPVLEPPQRIYQRLLAYDAEEASDLVEEYLKEKSLLEVYDEVLVPALGLAESDRHRGRLDEERWKFVRESMKEIVEELGEARQLGDVQVVPARPDEEPKPPCVLCLPARDDADEIVALMTAQLFNEAGCAARYMPVASLASEMVETVERQNAQIVLISALPPSALSHARYLCKRLRTRLKDLRLIVGLWRARSDAKRAMARLRCEQTDKVVTTLAAAVQEVMPLVTTLQPKP